MRWSSDQAWEWYEEQPWIVGCNFTPSTAINQLEMWQMETYDPNTIQRELGWANMLGFNTIRVYLHDLAWKRDSTEFKSRLDDFLKIAAHNKISTILVLFDDCWNINPKPGKQPEPTPGVHNSGWVQSPGSAKVLDSSSWSVLEEYAKDIITSFGGDERVLLWDLYNEPGNNKLGEKSLGLLEAAFSWAKKADPAQPISVGVWFDNEALNKVQLQESDIITFHNYHDATNLRDQITCLKQHGRPLICTEYMARTRESRFQTHLPIFKNEKVGCINWGFVSGKTQTIYPWGSEYGTPEPVVWFHDILRRDGTPFSREEVGFIREITR